MDTGGRASHMHNTSALCNIIFVGTHVCYLHLLSLDKKICVPMKMQIFINQFVMYGWGP